MRFFRFLTIFILIISTANVNAVDFEDAIFPELAPSGRAQAMGNAFQAKVDDSASAFYNPAGLGSVRYAHLHLSNLHFELNRGWMNAAAGGKFAEAAGDFTKGLSLDGTRQILENKPGALTHSRFHFMPNYTSRYFTLGYLVAQHMRGYQRQDQSMFEFAKRTDTGPYAAANMSLFGGVVKFGGSVIYLSRTEIKGEVLPTQAVSDESIYETKGKALIVTSGAKLTIPVEFLPTFSVVYHNSSDHKFSDAGTLGAPTKIEQTLDGGFAITPQIGQVTRLHFEINYKDMTKKFGDVSESRKILAGLELDIKRTFFMRLGYGDGFGSAGLGIKSKGLEVDMTTYAVDKSTNDFRGREDRRFSMAISTGF
jgi:hypothetical protein